MLLQTKLYNVTIDRLQELKLDALLMKLQYSLRELPAHIWPEKSDNQAGKDILQSLLNEHIRQLMKEQGWQSEVVPYTKRDGTENRDRTDFGIVLENKRVLMEVEFGNGSSDERNLMKLMAASKSGEMDLAFYVLPTSVMSKRIDSGLATLEATCGSLDGYPAGMVDFPLVVIGLDVDASNCVDWSKSKVAHPTSLSGTNGTKDQLNHVVRKFRTGTAIADISLALLPSEIAVAKEASRKTKRLSERSADAGGVQAVEQLCMFG